MNIEIAIKDACRELKKNKISSALLDSELLLSQVIKKDRKFVIEGISLSEGYDTYDECLKRFNEFTQQIDYLFPKIKPKEYRNDEDDIIQKVYIFQN